MKNWDDSSSFSKVSLVVNLAYISPWFLYLGSLCKYILLCTGLQINQCLMGLVWWLSGKESACNIGDLGLIPGGRRGNPLHYSRLENPMDTGAWWAVVHRVTHSQTRLQRPSNCSSKCLMILLSNDLFFLSLIYKSWRIYTNTSVGK